MSRYEIWHHWTADPDRSADPESPRPALCHGYWVLKFVNEALVGAAVWRRQLEWKRDWPGLTVEEGYQEYSSGNMYAPRLGPARLGLKELPKLVFEDDPELLQALKVVEARAELAGRLEILTGRSLLDLVVPSPDSSNGGEDEYFHQIRLWLEEATHALSYDGWTLEYVFDDELIADVTRSPLKRLRNLLLGRRRE